MFYSIDHIWDMKWTEFEVIQHRIELIKFPCLLTMIKNILKDGYNRLSHFHKCKSF